MEPLCSIDMLGFDYLILVRTIPNSLDPHFDVLTCLGPFSNTTQFLNIFNAQDVVVPDHKMEVQKSNNNGTL